MLISSLIYGNEVHDEIGKDFESKRFPNGRSDNTIKSLLGELNKVDMSGCVGAAYRPDLVDLNTGEIWEIKPILSAASAMPQLSTYMMLLTFQTHPTKLFYPGFTYLPPPVIPLSGGKSAIVWIAGPGVILYQVNDPKENFIALAAIGTTMAIQSLNMLFATVVARPGAAYGF